MKVSKQGECIRKVANFSRQVATDKYDKKTFDQNKFAEKLHIASPKLSELLKTIKALDEADMQTENTLYKHIIYTDVKSSSAGAKMIAAGMTVNGFKNVYEKDLKLNISDNPYKNFALLSSVAVYDKPFPSTLKKNILATFNKRPENIHGELIRFIILDQGFKEGIDVFDVKYVHLFEPLITKADEKQAIGRGTRYCGQKGLRFDPVQGWPLHVYKYDLMVDEDVSIHSLFMSNSGLDVSALTFASELELISQYGAVDYELTKSMRTEPKKGSIISNGSSLPSTVLASNIYKEYKSLEKHTGGGIKGKKKKGQNLFLDKAPAKRQSFLGMRKYIRERFWKYKWSNVKFENKCIDQNDNPSRIIQYTPTQDFVSRYFNNQSVNKGLLLWHSVGTGKTCSAIAIASNGFEPHGYTILWVTRHTLKTDIWKNMFGAVCSSDLRRRIGKGENIPENVKSNPLKYLSKSWILPISYKQFTNMLNEKNEIFKMMKKRNGATDTLRKTLVIIDEAHKLYSSDLPVAERPNIAILKSKIKKSYEVSGKDSVRLLLMTATPYTSDPMHLIKLLNLMTVKEMPETFKEFSDEYLDENSTFTEEGAKKYLDHIAGYISYLNREKDARQFAHPVYHKVSAKMSISDKTEQDKLVVAIQELQKTIEANESEVKSIPPRKELLKKKKLKEEIKELKDQEKALKKSIAALNKKEDFSQESVLNSCLKK